MRGDGARYGGWALLCGSTFIALGLVIVDQRFLEFRNYRHATDLGPNHAWFGGLLVLVGVYYIYRWWRSR